jgi:hypothetical protein
MFTSYSVYSSASKKANTLLEKNYWISLTADKILSHITNNRNLPHRKHYTAG